MGTYLELQILGVLDEVRAVVQWQDSAGEWHDVEGWQNTGVITTRDLHYSELTKKTVITTMRLVRIPWVQSVQPMFLPGRAGMVTGKVVP